MTLNFMNIWILLDDFKFNPYSFQPTDPSANNHSNLCQNLLVPHQKNGFKYFTKYTIYDIL